MEERWVGYRSTGVDAQVAEPINAQHRLGTVTEFVKLGRALNVAFSPKSRHGLGRRTPGFDGSDPWRAVHAVAEMGPS
jgi:hypothetical protein